MACSRANSTPNANPDKGQIVRVTWDRDVRRPGETIVMKVVGNGGGFPGESPPPCLGSPQEDWLEPQAVEEHVSFLQLGEDDWVAGEPVSGLAAGAALHFLPA